MPKDHTIQKVLVLGSGPIVIGQAAEFDYAGSQACRVLKEEGVSVVLVNSNPATIMTDPDMADAVYLEPLTPATVKRIIEREKPDSFLANIGGQTGLTIAMQLEEEGFLAAHHVRLLGTTADAIKRAEDRELFKETMESIGQPMIPSDTARSAADAVKIAEQIGYPVIIRPAYTLGGSGGGVAYDEAELSEKAANGIGESPIGQILVEKYIYGWKEIEFEVMRDAGGRAVAVCSMENVDPVGVHTGDSIVVAPALTLSGPEYRMLKKASLDIIGALGIAGGCNCQFALDPDSGKYAVIEVNPRVSRSSALASKATGYPIAKVTAKIALGYALDEIRNGAGGEAFAFLEPEIDYIVAKFPRWPFDKFAGATHTLGTEMKATGEVMAIGRCFEEALMKAVRGAEISADSLDDFESLLRRDGLFAARADDTAADAGLDTVDDLRLFRVYRALRSGVPAEEIYKRTKIDRWFLEKIKNLADYAGSLPGKPLSEEKYLLGKRLGYPDSVLRRLSGHPLPQTLPAAYKKVNTAAARFGSATPYFYSVFGEECESRAAVRKKERIVVLGAGPIRIGQGIEFDYSSVHCVRTLRDLGYEVVTVNNNPETVSTDSDISDRLYFEPLTAEDVMRIVEVEKPVGVVVAFGGQTAIKLAKGLAASGVNILGTSAGSIDVTEDREKFDALLEKLGISRPAGYSVHTEDEAVKAADALGYPVLVRPSYVIGGQNMTIAYAAGDVRRYIGMIAGTGNENPVLIDKYLSGAELEVDVVCDGEEILIPGIMEHIERAGVHSGDSIAVYPSFNLPDTLLREVIRCSEKISLAIGAKGLVNIQFLIHENRLYVIEVNPRSSRTVPYISKVTGVPVVDLAVRVMMGAKLRDLGCGAGLCRIPPYFAVKVPVFSFEKLRDVNAALGPEMKSTGEVLGIGATLTEALFKGLIAAGYKMPEELRGRPGILLTVGDPDKFEIVNLAKKFDDLGFQIYATRGTAAEIEGLGAEVAAVDKIRESDEIFRLIAEGKIDYIVNTGSDGRAAAEDYIALRQAAQRKRAACFTSVDTANALADIIRSRFNERNTELVNLNAMRTERQALRFSKMQGSGDDYIFFYDPDGRIKSPESIALTVCDRRRGIGGTGIVLIEPSETADAKMRIFNADGSEGGMAGNSIRCVGKYLYDNGMVTGETVFIETANGVRTLHLTVIGGAVGAVSVDMGKAVFTPEKVPVLYGGARMVDEPVSIGKKDYRVTCLSVGNPHCVVFVDKVDAVEVEKAGPLFEHDGMFPERVNTEFVRVVNPRTLKMRVWERGNGETWSCGTGAAAAAVAAVENGYSRKGEDITVKLRGGDLIVNYTDERVMLTGDAALVFEGEIQI